MDITSIIQMGGSWMALSSYTVHEAGLPPLCLHSTCSLYVDV